VQKMSPATPICRYLATLLQPRLQDYKYEKQKLQRGGLGATKYSQLYNLPLPRFFFWWRRLIHSKGARTAAASTPIGPRVRL
jgi:hypothetical protein